MNENYSHPEMPKDKKCEEGILKGMYKIKSSQNIKKQNSTFRLWYNIKGNDGCCRNSSK